MADIVAPPAGEPARRTGDRELQRDPAAIPCRIAGTELDVHAARILAQTAAQRLSPGVKKSSTRSWLRGSTRSRSAPSAAPASRTAASARPALWLSVTTTGSGAPPRNASGAPSPAARIAIASSGGDGARRAAIARFAVHLPSR
ncbi:MAG: hypothetical protein E6J90_22230 [Deltaproteobacteria bacterium]|nr:MAG: hypothetical protein E6J90_22230 [Deltaproteobacteria bacterium]